MEKKFLIAIALSVLILTIYPSMVKKYFPQKETVPGRRRTTLMSESEAKLKKLPTVQKTAEMPIKFPGEKEVELDNSSVRIVFSNIAGGINKVYLKKVGGLGDKELLLLDASSKVNKPLSFIAEDGSSGTTKPGLNFSKGADRIFFSSTVGNNINIEKTVGFVDDGGEAALRMDIKLKNSSDKTQQLNYKIIGPATLNPERKQDERFVEFTMKSPKKILRAPAYKAKKARDFDGTFSWVSSKNRYYCFVIRPLIEKLDGLSMDVEGKKWAFIDLDNSSLTIEPMQTLEVSYLIYIGSITRSELKRYELEDVSNMGMLDPISRLLFSILSMLYRVTRSYGIAIILLTFLMSMILFPLSFKSMKSMQHMQKMQPQVERIRKQYKDNPQKMNKEIMEFYKKNKLNPFGGCLPMLLQLPIFISLYQLILRSVELRGATFLWIKDLSLPDRLGIPFTLPLLGNHINLLPLLMIMAMFVQQRFTNPMAKSKDDQAKMLSFIMPIMFGFIFYNFASALVLYWLTNTIIMSTMQFVLLRPALATKGEDAS